MSFLNCKQCGAYINSDNDPDCFVYIGNYKRLHGEIILCERCREEREADQEAADSQAAWAESEAEKEAEKQEQKK